MAGMNKWRGGTALVTGASSGIGASFAEQLAKEGCNLILVARRLDKLNEIKDDLVSRHGVTVDVIRQDLSEPDSAENLFRRIGELGLRVDFLINNAGAGLSGNFATNEIDSELRLLQLNVLSLVMLTKLILPGMIERGFGDILMVASVACFLPIPTFASYAASKAFVYSFGVALGHELAGTGVSATVLSPGGTRTSFFEKAGFNMISIGDLILMSPEKTALIGLKAAARGRRSVVAGILNTMMVWSMKLVPQRISIWIAKLIVRFGGKS